MLKEIPEEYKKEFEPSNKLGLISTIDTEGCPHISLISSIEASGNRQIIWGQFTQGLSKKNVKVNPKTGFAVVSLKQELWRGRAVWTHERKEGPEYIMYNNKPMYRYNSYCGIDTVHYMDLVDITEKQKLNMASIAYNALLTKISKSGVKRKAQNRVMKPFAQNIFDKIGSIKFLSYVDEEGFPALVPILQAQAADSGRIVFSAGMYKYELSKIRENTNIAVFGMTMDMEDVLTKGRFKGFIRSRGVKLGVLDIDRVYNSMPPVAGYIYPEHKLEPVTEF
jgi:hypothetical protein